MPVEAVKETESNPQISQMTADSREYRVPAGIGAAMEVH
jgi:hypothetical protein